mmetsp:Transcript_25040/g.61562  ORF Transcript_25040/g.61562 Transcript_25040/m.61562 type:complete len:220 (+) Transcript_25040:3-662(+)
MPGLHAEQQVVQAVAELAHQQQHAGLAAARHQLPVHRELSRQRCEGGLQRRLVGRRLELDAHEEARMVRVTVLVGREDVAALLQQHAGDGMHDAGTVGAGELQDKSRCHGRGSGRKPTGGEAQLPVATRRQVAVMGDEDEGRALLAGPLQHQLEHRGGGVAVQVAGGLVGQHAGRPRDQGTGDGHALALAAGEFGRPVVPPLAQPHAGQHLGRCGTGCG